MPRLTALSGAALAHPSSPNVHENRFRFKNGDAPRSENFSNIYLAFAAAGGSVNDS
jgi:hypothetical protein